MKIYYIESKHWLESVSMIIKLLPSDNFQASELLEWLNNGNGKIFGLYNDTDVIVGTIFICEYLQENPKFIYIQCLCVEPNFRNLSIGEQLIIYICNKYQHIPIWAKVSNNNIKAKRLFRRIGFIQCSHKDTPHPLSKDYGTIYYPYIYQIIPHTWNMYMEECILNNNIKNIINNKYL